jgi:dephospho-CoA kinase
MDRDRTFEINIETVIERLFDDASLATEGRPKAAILMGGVAAGKTTLRCKNYSRGFVLIDAAEIFHHLSNGDPMLDFPEALIDQLESIGPQIARRAVAERRNIVTEIIGAELVPTEKLISALESAGYSVEVVAITCELEESIRRSANRGDNISAYYAEEFQSQWIIDACSQLVRASGAPEQIESTLPEGRLNSGMKPHDR